MNERNAVLITGAASGIGQATALRFSEEGYAVYGGDLDSKGLAETAELIQGTKGKFVPMRVDASDEEQVHEFVQHAIDRSGSISAAVACAGIARTGQVHELDLAAWNLMLSVNLTGTFLLAKHVMSHFRDNAGGAFVAVSSDAGVRGASGYAAYCASKHGVIGLIRCLALDYGKYGIRSNAVCPGFVQTKMMDQLFEEASSPEAEKLAYMKEVPSGRFAKPSEVAAVILHLASEEASYTNGICYSIDGGITAGHFG